MNFYFITKLLEKEFPISTKVLKPLPDKYIVEFITHLINGVPQ